MLRQRGRADIWKLLLPLPLAALMGIAVQMAARRAWQATAALSLRGEREDQAWRASARGPARTARAPVAAEEAPGEAAPRSPRPPSPTPRTRTESTEDTHSSGPAPETVAPSFEAALRTSEPPPAVASAPSLAPAPLIALTPAPEPRSAPHVSRPQTITPLRQAWARESVRAIRFDAGYYYGRGFSTAQLAEELARGWADQGVNLVYFYAYNRVYGARYRTRYTGNIMEDFGRQDLLGHVLRECHRRGIKVIAWLQGVQHKQVWEAHPEWRQKTQDGSDYKPDRDSYLLCARNPEVMRWWLGLVDDLLARYPELDGIDLAECQIDTWGDHACYCEHCRGEFERTHPGEAMPGDAWREFRANGLTRILLASSRLAHGYGKETHITTVFTAGREGKLMSSQQVRDAIGFDLEAVLSGADRPDVVQAELIWQQWAAAYSDPGTFTTEWTRAAVRHAKEMVGGRARLIAHVEVTDFGAGGLDGPSLAQTIAAAVEGQPHGIDIYDAHQLEETQGAARYLQMAWLNFSE